MSHAQHLTIVPAVRSKRGDPKPPRIFKATLWFTAAEWLMLMRLAATVEAGKMSFNAWFRKQHGLDGAEKMFDRRSTNSVMRHMRTPPKQLEAVRKSRRAAA